MCLQNRRNGRYSHEEFEVLEHSRKDLLHMIMIRHVELHEYHDLRSVRDWMLLIKMPLYTNSMTRKSEIHPANTKQIQSQTNAKRANNSIAFLATGFRV